MTTELEELAGELNQAVPARSGGRPSGYTEGLATEICEEVALGGAIYKMCAEKTHWPAEATIYRWANEIPAFGEAFKQARERKAHRFVEEMPAIADNAAAEDVRKAELRIKTRQWVAGMLNRSAYGERAPQVAVQTNINMAGLAAAAERKLIDLAERQED